MPQWTQAPDFNLPAVDGKTYGLKDFAQAKALVIVFSCNHCPYVQAYEGRMIDVQRDYQARGVVLAAINSNDDQGYPEDSFDNMARRAGDLGFNFHYLRDASQDAARAYGATHTPQLFVLGPDRRLAYTGKIDDDWKNPERVNRRYLREALDAILAGQAPALAETPAIGCTIKWKKA